MAAKTKTNMRPAHRAPDRMISENGFRSGPARTIEVIAAAVESEVILLEAKVSLRTSVQCAQIEQRQKIDGAELAIDGWRSADLRADRQIGPK